MTALIILATLAGCSGNEYNGEPVGRLTLIAGASEVTADGNSQIIIRAQVFNEQDEPIDNSRVIFSTNVGSLSVAESGTSLEGIAESYFSSSTVGTATITANASGFSQNVQIDVISGTSQTVDATAISLAVSKPSILTGNTELTTITAALLDNSNAVVPGAQVQFATDSGQLSASTVVTDSNGVASTQLSSGTLNYGNRVATVTASAGSLSRQIPIQITGSSISINSSREILITGGAAEEAQTTLTLTATDGTGNAVYDADISVAVAGTGGSPGAASLAASTISTDFQGKAQVVLTASSPGAIEFSASALGATASRSFNIDAAASAFYISTPATSPSSADIGDNVTVTVNAPTQANVTFATSLGTVSDGGPPASVVTTAVAAGTASVTLTSTEGGIATVEAFDAANLAVVDTTEVSFASPSSAADHLTLQSNLNMLPLSSGDTTHTTTLTATVYDANDFPVRNALVNFSLTNTTGGGEYLSNIYGLSGEDGTVTTTFTSGSLSSPPAGVTITASSAGPISASLPIVIGGSAASVVIGMSTSVSSINDSTAYQAPMSVLVTDSNGNPVANTTVNLNIKAAGYRTGTWQDNGQKCVADITSYEYLVAGVPTTSDPPYVVNEDLNENLVLDAGEDLNGDGALTPGLSAAGSIPQTVVTDENGLATFDLTYLKQYAVWVVSQINASTIVLGSETTSTLEFGLRYLISDGDACTLPHSPWGADDTWRDS